MAASVNRTCILHIGKPIKSEVKTFDNSLWNKVLAAKEARITTLSQNSKYSSVCSSLPDKYSENIGYHSSCYKNFTAVSNRSDGDLNLVRKQPDRKLLRSHVHHCVTSSSGIFRPNCIFCNKERKMVKRKTEMVGSCETKDAEQAIKNAATLLKDSNLLAKIGHVDFIAKEVKYHHSCRKSYINRASREHSEKSDYGVSRDIHNKAFAVLADYVQKSVITGKRAEFATSILSRYKSMLDDFGVVSTMYKTQNISDKILNHFGSDILLIKSSNKHGNIIHSSTMDKDEAIQSAQQYANSFEYKVTETALHIRATIQKLRATCKDLPSPLTAEAIAEGQADPPDVLLQFYRVLYTGSEQVSTQTCVERYVKSAAQDAVFVTTRGNVKPSKHLCLGLGLKSMTGSRRVLEIMNHFGHSISYHIAEALETDLAATVSDKNKFTPNGLLQQPGLATAVAWDNYDENSETLSGSGPK